MTELIINPPIGIFKGFSESGLEFKAEIVSPYNTEYHPLLGSFILVFVTREHAILGRITKFHPVGVMSSGEGDEYLAELSRNRKEVPEHLKESKLRYNIKLKLLGGIEHDVRTNSFNYTPSVRKLPHLGATVGLPTNEVLNYICSLGGSQNSSEKISIGYFTLGETVYDGKTAQPELPVFFDIENLVSKRTYVFARAGYGKSVLNKMLITKLYEKEQDVGMIIFDPEGEYAFPDKKGRPGLADVPELAEKIVVFTNKIEPHLDDKYRRMIAGRVSINLSDFSSIDIVSQCIAESKQEAVFASRLRALYGDEWKSLISEIADKRYGVEDSIIDNLIKTSNDKDRVIVQAVKNNLIPVVISLHDESSQMMDEVKYHLKKGRIVIVDVSLVSSTVAEQIAGLILNEIFSHNQKNFTVGSREDLIKVIAVIEEAQSVLDYRMGDKSPFVRWAKEGRKYELGSILVTQQPVAIASELLSQGDNFFAFHLLSADDLKALQRTNAHFSDDILANILNEPIKGNSYFWSAPDQPFVLPVRISNFEDYVNEKTNSNKELVKITAHEEFKQVAPSLITKLAICVKESIEKDSNIHIFSKVIIDGTECPEYCAVSCWYLSAGVASNLPSELDTYAEYSKNGNKYLKDKDINKCFAELHISTDKYTNSSSQNHYILKKECFEFSKSLREDVLNLKSSASIKINKKNEKASVKANLFDFE